MDDEDPPIETLAERVYDELEIPPGEVWKPSRIAEALGITIRRTARARSRGSYDERKRTITIKRGLSEEIEEWTIGHELGHHFGIVSERGCDHFGAALQMPRGAFRAARRELGEAWHEIAVRFGVLSTSVVMRVGELEHIPVAVILPGRGLYARNINADRETIRRLAKTGGPGIRSARLVDAPDRIVLIVDVEEAG